jgi:hypothetical protein
MKQKNVIQWLSTVPAGRVWFKTKHIKPDLIQLKKKLIFILFLIVFYSKNYSPCRMDFVRDEIVDSLMKQ